MPAKLSQENLVIDIMGHFRKSLTVSKVVRTHAAPCSETLVAFYFPLSFLATSFPVESCLLEIRKIALLEKTISLFSHRREKITATIKKTYKNFFGYPVII